MVPRPSCSELAASRQHRGVTKKVTQDEQRVSLGQVEHERRIRAFAPVSILDEPGGLPVMAADQVFQGPHGKAVAKTVRANVREPGLGAGPDPVCGALEHRCPGGERAAACLRCEDARPAVRGD
jgi:hypothetical protein